MCRDSGKHLIVMQDGVPSHRNLLTIEELHKSGISPTIEQLWDYMKDWIGDRYLVAQDRKLSYDQPLGAVRAAWDAKIDLMQARCQAVTDAQGGQPPY
jgi:hypothetical protein